ncbi:CheR family methyltransferase [Sulfurospirillum arcachonense]|uniref:CheR family methyltransferase n=1 Tax=Sulfurospirillum arcachonense TaxID=57666 RepID=UPI0004693649|nr:CheR family methyltransferase [Sulfurospirillum arcachonense]
MFFRKKTPIEDIEVKEEKKEFSTFGLNDILHYIKREIGVDLFVKKGIIETKMKLFCEDRELHSFKELHEAIQYKSDLRQELINLLTVNETYFYREEKQLQEAIDFAKQRGQTINILCAPCASGEEVYSLSMMLTEQMSRSVNFTITGIDINSEAIKKANQGEYSQRSLHKLDDSLKDKYFIKSDNMYTVNRHLFPSVRFTQVNIFENSFLNMGHYDIIFSRNMLIYFDEEFRVKTMKRFNQLLKDEGRIYLGHADIVPKDESFVKHGFGSSCYYTKG